MVGYAVISLCTGYLSYAGIGTNVIALPLFTTLITVALFALIWKRKSIRMYEEKISLRILIPIILFGCLNAAIVLAPMILERAPHFFNDHTTYISIAEYLRDFGYFTPKDLDTAFWQDNTALYESAHFRMGAQFFVAFTSSLFQIPHTISIYPSILGMVAVTFITSLSFFYICLREEKGSIGECLLILYFSLIAINLNSENIIIGFLPQTFGVMLFITLSGLLYEFFQHTKKHFVTIGILFAALVLTYHEVTLFYGMGLTALLIFHYFFQKTSNKIITIQLAITHLATLIISPIATREFILGIQSSSQSNDVGWYVSYSLVRYLMVFFGQDFPYLIANSSIKLFMLLGMGSVFFYLFLFFKYFRHEKSELRKFLLILFIPVIVSVFIFSFVKLDPFHNELGHSWRIFKVVSWSFWLIAILAGFAVFSYFKESKWKKILIILTLFSLLPSTAANIYANYRNHKIGLETYTNNDQNPLNDFEYLAQNKAHYGPANIIDYESHPNYPYLILSILKDSSVGDLSLFGSKLVPSTDPQFYQWINYRREHANTEAPITNLAGFFIYPPKSSSVYLFTGFGQRELHGSNHLTWLSGKVGSLKIIVPKGEKAQFTTSISNWQNKQGKVEITFKNTSIFTADVTKAATLFTSPILPEGNHEFQVKFYGELRTPDKNDRRSLALMFKNTTISRIN